KKSSSIAIKKADRVAHDGVIVVVEGQGKALLLTLHSETDFVARNIDFVNLANELAQLAWTEGVETMQSKSLDIINPVVQKVGEKIELGKVEIIEGDVIGSYVHGGKSAVIVNLTGGSPELAKDIAMHIAAMKPAFIKADDITEDDKTKVIEVFEKEVAESDKPEEIKKKMLEGKISTYFKEQTLMDQFFIKNPDITIFNLLKEKGATLVRYIQESIG
ncbi:MAG: translation elongation factor Ts, partial [Candidatus Woesearchaeota archaeon]